MCTSPPYSIFIKTPMRDASSVLMAEAAALAFAAAVIKAM